MDMCKVVDGVAVVCGVLALMHVVPAAFGFVPLAACVYHLAKHFM